MVYEHLSRCFIPKDPSLRFLGLFQVIVIITLNDIPRSMALMLGTNKFLAMVKNTRSLRPITIGEVFLRLIIRRSIVL